MRSVDQFDLRSVTMLTELMFLHDAYACAVDTVVGEVDDGEDAVRSALERTVFYATGGGQLHDTGVLGDTARLEVPLNRLGDVVALREEVVTAVQAAGYRYVTLDLEGLRSGNLTVALGLTARSSG